MHEGKHVLYNNRMVPVEGFRTFVYGPQSQKKLVSSWDEYTQAVKSGQWFSHPNDVSRPKKRGRKKCPQ